MKKALSLVLTAVMLLGVLSTLAATPVFATETTEWSKETPKGSGTKDDPYLIATPGSFIWIAENMNNSTGKDVDTDNDGTKDLTSYAQGKTSYVGVYFEQVCDIDFEGAEIESIGDYLCDTNVMRDGSKEASKVYGGFGGNYNGNGFALKNATVKAKNQNKDTVNWCVGLFGGIYGATLRNMVLDNIDVIASNPHAGILVGKAYAPTWSYDETANTTSAHPDSERTDFNLIENIVITSTSSITASSPLTSIGDMSTAVKAGAIAGTTVGTTISNCTSNGALNVSIGVRATGGIVGAAGHSTVIDTCISNSAITVAGRPSTMTSSNSETAIGGIVGHILSWKAEGSEANYSKELVGEIGVNILNCLNTGATTIADTVNLAEPNRHIEAKNLEWGGIVGMINSLAECTDTPGDYSYLIENCYNTAADPGLNGMRKAGIVGSAWSAGSDSSPSYQKTVDTLYIKDSMSVKTASGYYAGTNEFNCQTNVTTDGLQSIVPLGLNATKQDGTAYEAAVKLEDTCATRALTDNIYVAKADGTGYELSATTTLRNVVDALAKDVKLSQELGKAVAALGYQKKLDNSDGSSYRLIFGIHKLEYRNVGVSVLKQVEGGATTIAATNSDVAYTGVRVYGETAPVTANDLGVEYLTTLTLNDIPAEGTVTYTVSTYVTNRDTAQTRTNGDKIILTFVNGECTGTTLG